MPYLVVFAAGFLLGKKWDRVKTTVGPVVGAASQRFDAFYASTARTVAQTLEDVDDRIAERRYRAASQLTN
jgi:hypothetical protein